MEPMCFSHGWGPFTIEKGNAQHSFRELRTRSFSGSTRDSLGAGVYYLVSVWSPRVLEAVPNTETVRPRVGGGSLGKVYATARSLPVRIAILPSSNR